MILPVVYRWFLILACIFLLHSQSVSSLRIPVKRSAIQSKKATRVGKRDSTTDPSSLDACGQLFARHNNDGAVQFAAREAYDCLKSVPFNAVIAKRFLEYYRDTLRFQSTLAYLRDPPASYQQPAVDLLEGIDGIVDNVDTGVYVNEYAFEADLLRLAYRAHDGHVNLNTGLMYTFTFGSPVTIVSLSSDGKEYPKPYLSGKLSWI